MKLLEFSLCFFIGAIFGTYYGIYIVHKLVGDVRYIYGELEKTNADLRSHVKKIAELL
jgi:preprotein translocase subunit SecF